MRLPAVTRLQALLSGDAAGRRKKLVKREPRHAIRARLIYRKRGGLFWYKGTLEDFSLTGIRFRGEQYLPSDSPVEMSFTVPQENDGKQGEEFFCWAKVVRAVLPTLSDSQFGLAAQILRYRSQRQLADDWRAIVGEVRGPLSTPKESKHPASN
jgi:hypothetical protein